MERLKNREIIIYGDERYIHDFLYVFKEISAKYFVDDEKSAYAEEYTKIGEEDPNKIFVIICKYNDLDAISNLEKAGFKKNINYASAESFFYLLDFPIIKISQNKHIFIWGTGENSEQFFEECIDKNPLIDIRGYIDSALDRVNKQFHSKNIYDPKYILKRKNIFFIIASKKYYTEISNILKNNGLGDGEDFTSYLNINTKASSMMRKTIYDIPRLDYVCKKPFNVAELKPEGKFLICGGMKPGAVDFNIPMYYSNFEDIWHSNIMKVIRLSMINGTYTFCNPYNCSYIEGSGKAEIDVNELENEKFLTKNQLDYIKKKSQNPKNTVFDILNYSTKEKAYPDTIQCGWDESCNLHCPSCRKEVYYANEEKLVELRAFTTRVKKEVLLTHTERIKVAGLGETFASEIYQKLIYDKEVADEIKNIGILSNGFCLTPSKFDELAQLWENINVFISMDGSRKETAEKLRAGLNFDTWKNNMSYISKMKQEDKVKKLAFNFVVQRDNYEQMPEFAEMCLNQFHADQIKFSRVFNWGNYSAEEFNQKTMFDDNNNMKLELKELICRNSILERPEIHLFRWINW